MLFIGVVLAFTSCGGGSSTEGETAPPPESMVAEEVDPMESIGIGPITSLELGEIDTEMAAAGEAVYSQMCTACHLVDKKFIGPSPKGILERRSPEWVMNMILNPEEMILKDPTAKKLLAEFNYAPMANQNLTEEQARQVLEYFRTL